MTQEIKIELDDDDKVTTNQLLELITLATRYPNHNIRVNGSTTNIKIYVGPYYRESYRFWILPDGRNLLVERDHSDPSDDEAIWDRVEFTEAHIHLSPEQT
jgi:hypothetical protein